MPSPNVNPGSNYLINTMRQIKLDFFFLDLVKHAYDTCMQPTVEFRQITDLNKLQKITTYTEKEKGDTLGGLMDNFRITVSRQIIVTIIFNLAIVFIS